MLGLAKNQSAMFHAAGLCINLILKSTTSLGNIILQILINVCMYVYLSRDLKEHLRRLQQQSDSRRRAAVMEMMRQRAAEVAGNSG